MKRIFSACIIFAFLLTSFTGCGKLKNVPGLSQSDISNEVGTSVQSDNSKQSKPTIKLPQTSEPSNTLNKDNAFVPIDITQQPDTSSKIETINPSVSSLTPFIYVPAHYGERIAEPDEGQPRRGISSSDKFACVLVAGVPILLACGISAAWNAYEEYCFRNIGIRREFYKQRLRERERASRSRQR
jgi:predicted small lipoprotein YifL